MTKRTPFFTATLVPVVLGATTAWNPLRVFNAAYSMSTLIAALCLHDGTNMMPATSLIALATITIAIKAIEVARERYEQPTKMTLTNAFTIIIHFLASILLILGCVRPLRKLILSHLKGIKIIRNMRLIVKIMR